jgi:hypothetical protein
MINSPLPLQRHFFRAMQIFLKILKYPLQGMALSITCIILSLSLHCHFCYFISITSNVPLYFTLFSCFSVSLFYFTEFYALFSASSIFRSFYGIIFAFCYKISKLAFSISCKEYNDRRIVVHHRECAVAHLFL